MSLNLLKNFVFVALLAAPLFTGEAAVKKQNLFEIKEESLPEPIQATVDSHAEMGQKKLQTGGVASIRSFEITAQAKNKKAKLNQQQLVEGLIQSSSLCESNQKSCTSDLIKNAKADLLLPKIQEYLKKAEEKREKNFQFSTLMIQNFILDSVGKDFHEYSIQNGDKLTSLLIDSSGKHALVLELNHQR